MSAREFGKKYPGSGGARRYPIRGGSDWFPLPEDTFYEEPITEVVIDGVEILIGYETRKRYH